MSNTLTLKIVQYIAFSGSQKFVSHLDIMVDGLLHTLIAGDCIDKILVDGNEFYFYKDGHFYTIPGATMCDSRLRYSFAFLN